MLKPFPITNELKKVLSHILWIGGATDAGKTSVTQKIADNYNLQVYNYDRFDFAHHKRLLESNIRTNLTKTLEENWIHSTPIELLEDCKQAFYNRFSLMIEDLMSLPTNSLILAEGYGLIPELIAPLLSDTRKAVYLFSTATFKYSSMERRQKLSELGEKAELARKNLFIRDMLLGDWLRQQAQAKGFTVFDIDGTSSIEQTASLMEKQFEKFIF